MVLWCSVGDFNNREGSDSEDQPEHTLIAEPFLSCKQVYVTLATSPLLKKNGKNMGKMKSIVRYKPQSVSQSVCEYRSIQISIKTERPKNREIERTERKE